MPIDLMTNKIGLVLKKSLILDEATAWIQAFDPTLKLEIIRDWIQRDQLMARGVDGDGVTIGTYSLATEMITNGRKPEGSKFNLFESGDLYASMFVLALANEVIIEADTDKIEDKNWWREEILKLTNEQLEKLAQRVKIKYIDYARRVLGID